MEIPSYTAIRTDGSDVDTPNQLYVEYQDDAGSREFYDLTTDPYQLESLHGDPTTVRTTQQAILAQRLASLRDCGAGTCQALESD